MITIDPTELYKAISKSEADHLEKTIYRRVNEIILQNERLQEVDCVFTQSFWLTFSKHFIHFDLKVRIVDYYQENGQDIWRFRDSFSGPLTFFNDNSEFLLAKELHYLDRENLFISYERSN